MRNLIKASFLTFVLLFQSFSVKADSIAIKDLFELEQFANNLLEDVMKNLVNEQDKKSKVDTFKTIFVDKFDMEFVSKFLLGKQYKELSVEKLDDFKKSFLEFNVYSWVAKFDLYDGQNVFVKSITEAKKDDQAFINISIEDPKNSDTIELQFRIRKVSKNYKIADIKVASVSMILTYKKEFKSLASSAQEKNVDEFEYLLKFIKDKTSSMKDDYLN